MAPKNQPLSGNDLARFSGPGTFMRLPSSNELHKLDVAILGVPIDIGTSWRSGTRFGPKQVRNESAMIRPYNLATGAAPFDSLQVADIGDLAVNTFSLSDSLRIISESYDAILQYDAVPAAIGGDHSITLPILRAIARRHGPVAVVHVDAHADVNDEMFGERECHGTVFRRAYEEGLIQPAKTYQVGLRGSGYSAEDFTEAAGWGFQQFPAHEFWGRDLIALGAEIRRDIGDAGRITGRRLPARPGGDAQKRFTCQFKSGPEQSGGGMKILPDLALHSLADAGGSIVECNRSCFRLPPGGYEGRRR